MEHDDSVQLNVPAAKYLKTLFQEVHYCTYEHKDCIDFTVGKGGKMFPDH